MGTTCSKQEISDDEHDITISEIDEDDFDDGHIDGDHADNNSELLLEFHEQTGGEGLTAGGVGENNSNLPHTSMTFDKGILRTVLAGNVQEFPDVGIPKAALSVFISSTGYDSFYERSILMQKILPKLQAKGNRYGIHVSFSDVYSMNDFHNMSQNKYTTADHSSHSNNPSQPRLGAISASSAISSVWQSRADEIKRCYETSGGMFFLSLLGDNYGFQPLPKYIDQVAFDKLLSKQQISSKKNKNHSHSQSNGSTTTASGGSNRRNGNDDNTAKSDDNIDHADIIVEYDDGHTKQHNKKNHSSVRAVALKLLCISNKNHWRNSSRQYRSSHRKQLHELKFKRDLLLKWYRLDENHVPPRYELKELPPLPSIQNPSSNNDNIVEHGDEEEKEDNPHVDKQCNKERKQKDSPAKRSDEKSQQFWFTTYPMLLKILDEVTIDSGYKVGRSLIEYESILALKLDVSRCHWIHRRFDWRDISIEEYESNEVLPCLSDSYCSSDTSTSHHRRSAVRSNNLNAKKLRRLQRTLQSKLMDCSLDELPVVNPKNFLCVLDNHNDMKNVQAEEDLLLLGGTGSIGDSQHHPSALLLPLRQEREQQRQQQREIQLTLLMHYLEGWEENTSNLLMNELNHIIKLKSSWDRDGLGLGIPGREVDEMMLHAKLTYDKAKIFVGRDSLIETAMTLIGQSNRPGDDGFGGICCMVVGKSGSGKSSFIAKLANILTNKQSEHYRFLGNNSIGIQASRSMDEEDELDDSIRMHHINTSPLADVPVIVRYCGKSQYSRDPLKLISSIILQIYLIYYDDCQALIQEYKVLQQSTQNNHQNAQDQSSQLSEEEIEIASFLVNYSTMNYDDIVNIFHQVIARYPIILFLDSLHQLSTTDDVPNRLAFLAGIKPHERSRIIVSTYPDEYMLVKDSLQQQQQQLSPHKVSNKDLTQRQWVAYYMIESKLRAARVPRISIKGLETKNDDSTNSTKFFVDLLLKSKSRTLSSKQLENLLYKISKEPTALYVKLAVNIASTWRSFDDCNSSNTTPQKDQLNNPSAITVTPKILSIKPFNTRIIAQIFKTLEDSYGKKLVGYALGYLTIAREGVSDNEMIDLLSLSDTVMEEFYRSHPMLMSADDVLDCLSSSNQSMIHNGASNSRRASRRLLKQASMRSSGSLSRNNRITTPDVDVIIECESVVVDDDATYQSYYQDDLPPRHNNQQSSGVSHNNVLNRTNDDASSNSQHQKRSIGRLPITQWIQLRQFLTCHGLIVERRGGSGSNGIGSNSTTTSTTTVTWLWYHQQLYDIAKQRYEKLLPRLHQFMAIYFNDIISSNIVKERLITTQPLTYGNTPIWFQESKINQRRCIEGYYHFVESDSLEEEALMELCSLPTICAIALYGDLYHFLKSCHRLLDRISNELQRQEQESMTMMTLESSSFAMFDASKIPGLVPSPSNAVSSGSARVKKDTHQVNATLTDSMTVTASSTSGIMPLASLGTFSFDDLPCFTQPLPSLSPNQTTRYLEEVIEFKNQIRAGLHANTRIQQLHQRQGQDQTNDHDSRWSHHQSYYQRPPQPNSHKGGADNSKDVTTTYALIQDKVKITHYLRWLIHNISSISKQPRSSIPIAAGNHPLTSLVRQDMETILQETSLKFSNDMGWYQDNHHWQRACNLGGIKDFQPLITTMIGHRDCIRALSWNHDGTQLLSASDDGTISLWEVLTAKRLATFEGHVDAVTSVVWNHDCTRIASSSLDQTVRIWDSVSGDELQCLAVQTKTSSSGHIRTPTPVTALSWSLDSTLLAAGDAKGHITVWESALSHTLKHFLINSHTGRVNALAWNRSGSRLASCGNDKVITIWYMKTGQRLATCAGHTNRVTSISWSKKKNVIVSASADKTMRLWDGNTGEEIFCTSSSSSAATNGANSGTGVASSSHSKSATTCVSWNPNGKFIASTSGEDQSIVLWKLNVHALDDLLHHRNKDPQNQNQGQSNHVSPSTIAARNAAAGLKYTYSTQSLVTVKSATGKSSPALHTVSSTLSATTVAAANGSGHSPSTTPNKHGSTPLLEEVARWQAHDEKLSTLAWSRDGQKLASGSWDDSIKVWDAMIAPSDRYEGHQNAAIHSVVWSHDDSRLLTGGEDDRVVIWDSKNRTIVRTFKHSMSLPEDAALVLSANSPMITGNKKSVNNSTRSPGIAGMSNNNIQLQASPSTQHRNRDSHSTVGTNNSSHSTNNNNQLSGCGCSVTCVAWNHDSSRFLSGSNDNTIKVWNASTGDCDATLRGHTDRITCAIWSHDGYKIASGSEDSTIRIWEVVCEATIFLLQGHQWTIRDLSWNRDGTKLLSCSEDKTIRMWDVINGDLIIALDQGQHHTSWITAITWNRDGTQFASTSADGQLIIWEATKYVKMLRMIEKPSLRFSSIAWYQPSSGVRTNSSNASLIAVGSSEGVITLWNSQTGLEVNTLEGHTSTVTSLSWNHSGTKLASSSEDKTVKIWDSLSHDLSI